MRELLCLLAILVIAFLAGCQTMPKNTRHPITGKIVKRHYHTIPRAKTYGSLQYGNMSKVAWSAKWCGR